MPTKERTKPRCDAPHAAIVWLYVKRRCQRCQRPMYSPGPVGRIDDAYRCWECMMHEAPALGWLLWLALSLRLSFGTLPGSKEM